MTTDRDRDAAGRPRNARPRDAAGRPLSPDAVGEAPIDESVTDPDDVLTAAQGALDAGRPFAAHEYLENAWHHAPAAERDLWRGLAQIAVGLTHLQRGNRNGAVSLLDRGTDQLAAYAGTAPHRIDVDGIATTVAELLVRLQGDAPEVVPALRLTLG